jgi:hypothetical protein
VTIPETLIFSAGILQIVLVAGSLLIPKLLNWKGELAVVSPLIRQIFWTYAGYILVTNFSFGLISVLSPASLVDGSFLASAVTLFIGLYWLTRILIQFFYFDRKTAPKGWIYTTGEVGLVVMFVFFTIVYLYAFWLNALAV